MTMALKRVMNISESEELKNCRIRILFRVRQ